MESCRRSSDGVGEPPANASISSANQRRSSHDMRGSQASNATSTSASSTGSHAYVQSIAFATSDHGVVSVNLADLSNALGVRCGDVVPQRLMFQARSAPSYRIDRSLLGSALGSPGALGAGGSAATPTTTTAEPSTSDSHPRDAWTTNATSPGNAVDAAVITRPTAPYQRRHSILHGTRLDGDFLALPAGSLQQSNLRPTPAAPSAFTRLPLHPPPHFTRRGTPPPPGGVNALRRALAGDRAAAVPFTAGSMPSPLRCSGGLLSQTAGVSPEPFHLHGRRNNGGCNACEDSNGEAPAAAVHDSDNNDNERTGLLAASSAVAAAAAAASPASDAPGPDRASIAGWNRSVSTTASFYSGSPTPAPLSLQEPANDSVDHNEVSASSPSRSVHFSENVIGSISVARGEDEYMHLLVVYSRPWYAYVLLAVVGFLLGLAFLSNLYLERDQTPLKDRVVSVPFVFFLITGMGAVGMLLHLVVTWRPDSEEEQSFFEDPVQRGRLPRLWTLGLLFVCGFTASLVVNHASGTTVAVVMTIGLVGHLVTERVLGSNEGVDGDCITCWDIVGCAAACLGAVLAAVSSAVEEILDEDSRSDSSSSSRDDKNGAFQSESLALVGWGCSALISGIGWTLFMRQLRDMSQHVSQQFLLTSSLGICTVVLGLGTYVADALLSSDSTAQISNAASRSLTHAVTAMLNASVSATTATQEQFDARALVPCCAVFPDLAILLGGGLCFFLCWYAFHTVSFYVDHLAGAACMAIGAALSTVPLTVLLAFHTWPPSKPELWATFLTLSVAGTLTLVLGASAVVYGGMKYRREVEIRIVVE